jgi:hypothetical protein
MESLGRQLGRPPLKFVGNFIPRNLVSCMPKDPFKSQRSQLVVVRTHSSA